jgi:hypothetical protein
MAVQYVIVPQRLAPSPFTGDEQTAAPALVAALGGQLDLERLDVDSAVVLYRNTAFVPGRAVVDDPEVLEASGPDDLRTLDLAAEARPALRDGDDNGVAVGELDDDVTLYQSVAGSSGWVLEVDGRRISPRPAFGWANAFPADEGGRAELRYDTPLARRLLLVLQVGLWIAALWLLIRRRRPTTRPTPAPPASAEPAVPDSVAVLPTETPMHDLDAGHDPAPFPVADSRSPAPVPADVAGGPGAEAILHPAIRPTGRPADGSPAGAGPAVPEAVAVVPADIPVTIAEGDEAPAEVAGSATRAGVIDPAGRAGRPHEAGS